MKQLSGLLVEYFVVGAVALLWLVPLLQTYPAFTGTIASKETGGVVIALTVPAIYVVGMVCDFLGYWLTHWKKDQIDREAWAKVKKEDPGSQIIHVYAVCYEPKLAEEIESRSSRDRVARGSLAAFIPVIFVQPVTWPFYLHFAIVAFVTACIAMLWYRFQKLSTKYEVKAAHVLQERHKINLYSNAQQ